MQTEQRLKRKSLVLLAVDPMRFIKVQSCCFSLCVHTDINFYFDRAHMPPAGRTESIFDQNDEWLHSDV